MHLLRKKLIWTKKNHFFVVCFVFASILLLGVGHNYYLKSQKKVQSSVVELTKEKLSTMNFKDLKKYFIALANAKGASYAFDVLKGAQFKANIDTHLMAHFVGDILYKQKGADGIQICTQDFRNACSHAIVIGLFQEKGLQALPEISKACEKAPGGKGAYGMCFHGLGHGILAFTGYDIPKTIELCKKTGTQAKGDVEYRECVGGAVMEIISGGDHDKKLWKAQSDKYLTTKDPLYPCTADYMPEEVKSMCYIYITPHLFVYAGADLGHPEPIHFKKAFTYCDKLSKVTDEANRNACYSGFGKDFLGLALKRDIRNVADISDEEIKKIQGWCDLANGADGKSLCYGSAMGSIYWGGENDVKGAIRFCNLIESEKERGSCFIGLTGMVKFYVPNEAAYLSYCSKIPEKYTFTCKKA